MLMNPCIFTKECKYECDHKKIHENDFFCNLGRNTSMEFKLGMCPSCTPYKKEDFLEEEFKI